MRSILGLSALAAALAMGLGACSDDGTGPEGSARVTVHLTDAPGDVLAAVVTIDEIYLQGGPGGRVVLSDEPQTVDLVQLQNTTVIVADADVTTATYGELRFVISGGYVEVETATGSEIFASDPDYEGLPDGATVTGSLQMPSLGSSGLKVNFDEPLEITSNTSYLVDFEVAQSFGHQAGASNMWVMHPVINGAVLNAVGTVEVTLALGTGVSLPSIGGTAVTLADFKASLDGEEVAFVSSEGTFKAVFEHVIPGTYELTLVGPTGLTFVVNPAIPLDVDVTAGGTATVAFTITSATGS